LFSKLYETEKKQIQTLVYYVLSQKIGGNLYDHGRKPVTYYLLNKYKSLLYNA